MRCFIHDVYLPDLLDRNKYSCLEYFYNLFKKENMNINKVIGLIEYIEKLGFPIINYCSNYSFSDKEYVLKSEIFNENYKIDYLDNMKMLPSCLNRSIKYTSDSSNYLIYLCPRDRASFSELLRNKKIYLNNLSFDVDRLPKSLSKEDIFDSIVNKSKQNKKFLAITDSVYIEKGIHNLKKTINGMDLLFNKIDSASDREELVKLLKKIEMLLGKMQNISVNYEAKIYENFGFDMIKLVTCSHHL